MRRKRSDEELPRFVNGTGTGLPSFRWRRRYALYLLGFVAVCWILYPRRPGRAEHGKGGEVNWKNFAYSLTAIDGASLCHAVLVFDALARLGSKADRVLFYPNTWDTRVDSAKDRDSQLLVMARDEYGVKLQPTKVLAAQGRTQGTHSIHPGPPCKAPRIMQGTKLTA